MTVVEEVQRNPFLSPIYALSLPRVRPVDELAKL